MKILTTVPKGGQTSDLPNMAPTRPQSKDGTAPLPPLGPPRSGNCVAGLSPSLSGPSRRRRHACECGPTLPGRRRPRGNPPHRARRSQRGAGGRGEGAGVAAGPGARGALGARSVKGGAPRWRRRREGTEGGGSGRDGDVCGTDRSPCPRRVPAARQGPVAPVSRGGEAQAQEEAAGAEPQLVLHGRQVPRWAPGAFQGSSPCPFVSLHVSRCSPAALPCVPASLHVFPCVPPSLRALPRVPPGSPSGPPRCFGIPFNVPLLCPAVTLLSPAVPTGCYKITTVFSHAQTVVLCVGCSTVLCQPTGGKARLTEGG